MKTLIDIAETQMKALDDIAREENSSRAAVIRTAIENYLSRRAPDNDGFGLWRSHKLDGLDYQEKIRGEW